MIDMKNIPFNLGGLCGGAVLVLSAGSAFAKGYDSGSQLRNRIFSAEARDMKTGALLYREIHSETQKNGKPWLLETRYLDADDKQFAFRTLHYEGKPEWAPDYLLTDERSGRIEQVTTTSSNVFLKLRERRDAEWQNATIENRDLLVIDGGFDQFIRARKNILAKGQRVKFDFVVPAQLDAYSFVMQKSEEMSKKDDVLGVVLKISNWFVRMFIDTIEVAYNAEPLELNLYEGVSNIRDKDAELLEVTIRYPVLPSQVAWQPVLSEQAKSVSNQEMTKTTD